MFFCRRSISERPRTAAVTRGWALTSRPACPVSRRPESRGSPSSPDPPREAEEPLPLLDHHRLPPPLDWGQQRHGGRQLAPGRGQHHLPQKVDLTPCILWGEQPSCRQIRPLRQEVAALADGSIDDQN
ncbi:hypothetical protein CEXT_452371 [Caerostris extrusa]|uniref:Uncharacterized protein n=1 Tax=Caerostris extrusa TaxID=172846 RepID=A0AAV4TBX6_CAEEX|nr:hypothetical protein CEXT_452371 [Caerostris extrusa]